MRGRLLNSLSVIALLALVSGTCLAQTKPKPKPKAAPKPPVTSTTKGTAQLPGDNGKIGVTYQLGDKDQELHFTLESAQVAPYYSTGDDFIIATGEQRILILTYTVQNPQKQRDIQANWNSFQFTAISPDDQNFTANGYAYLASTSKRYDSGLKPAQKTKLVYALPIYAAGPVKKLMVQRGRGAVLRYDLEGKLGKMTSIFSADGIDMVADAKAELAKPFEMNGWELEVQEVGQRNEPIGAYKPNSDKTLFTVQVKFTNLLAKPRNLGWMTIKPTLTDENGEKIGWLSDFVSMASGTTIGQEIGPGESIRGLMVCSGTRLQKAAKLKLVDDSGKRSVTIIVP